MISVVVVVVVGIVVVVVVVVVVGDRALPGIVPPSGGNNPKTEPPPAQRTEPPPAQRIRHRRWLSTRTVHWWHAARRTVLPVGPDSWALVNVWRALTLQCTPDRQARRGLS